MGAPTRKKSAVEALDFVEIEHPDTPWDSTAKRLQRTLQSFSIGELIGGEGGGGGGR